MAIRVLNSTSFNVYVGYNFYYPMQMVSKPYLTPNNGVTFEQNICEFTVNHFTVFFIVHYTNITSAGLILY